MAKDSLTINLTPNHLHVMQTFAKEAIGTMEQFTRSTGTVEYSHVYAFVIAVRMVLNSLDETSEESCKAFLQFRDGFNEVGTRMFARLEKLREWDEKSDINPF
jgi:hypothetical protein